MAVALAVTVLWGFGPTYFFRVFITTRELSPVTHVHGFVFSCWIALLVAQAALISTRRPSLHRRVGAMSVALAAGVVVTGVAVELFATPSLAGNWQAVNGLLASTLFLIETSANHILFGLLVAAAFRWRKRPEIHKRLMVLATLAIMPAAVARVLDEFGWPISIGPFGFEAPDFGLVGLVMPPWLAQAGFLNLIVAPFFAALAAYDLASLRRVHTATALGGLALFLFHPAVLLVSSWMVG